MMTIIDKKRVGQVYFKLTPLVNYQWITPGLRH